MADLDLIIKEEQRLKAQLSQQEQAVVQTRRELADVVAAKRVVQRLSGADQGKGAQHSTPTKSSGNGSAEALTIKGMALEALKAAYPRGFENAGIREYAMKKHQREISSGTLAVMLGRLRDEDGAVEVNDHVWFWVPLDKRK